MTVASAQNRAGPFPGDGVSTQVDFNVKAQKNADIRIFRKVLATGVQTQLAEGSDYSLALVGNGGRASFAVPMVIGTHTMVVRVPEPIQETDFINNGAFAPETLEAALDYQMMVSQRAFDLLARSLVLADGDSSGSGSYNAKSNRITSLANGVNSTDAVTLGQVIALIGSGGGGGGGGSIGWPSTPIPPDILDQIVGDILTESEFQAVFAPINSQLGNLANSIIGQNSTISQFGTQLGTVSTSLTNMQAAVDALEQLQGDGTAILTAITTERNERIAGDNATASVLSTIGAVSGGVAFDLNLSTVRVSPTESLAQRFGSISSVLASNTAAINSEVTARTTADTALVSTIAKVGAATPDGVSFLLNLDSVRVTGTETLGQRLTAIASSVNGATAAIASEASTRATAVSSLATTVSTLQSTVGGFSTAISANATAINGVYAQYSVKIDNNGRVSGFGLVSQPVNGTIVSTFNFNSDVFRIWNGTSAVPPFVVVGGVVRMQNVEIQNANIVNCSIDKLTVGTLNANMNIGTGRVIFDNGAVMLVQGIGFGTSSQFIEWFGTRPAGGDISLCSEANARSYKKINGDEYMGGTLTVGTLQNSARSTSLANNAELTVGPFGTNGNTKSVVFSYSYSSNLTTGGGGGNSSGAISATINCYRRIGAGSETLVATLNASGTYSIETEPGLSSYSQAMGGSVTFTDNVAGTDNRTFRAAIAARTLGFAGGSAQQSLGITSTEQ